MFLQTDDQTIDDLRLFSKRDGTGIFDLYNNTHTRGGEVLLREMFQMPLADKSAINHRSSIIEQFCRLKIGFPFDSAALDMAEKYMTSVHVHSGNQGRQTLGEKDIQNGVSAVIVLIKQLQQFISGHAVKSMIPFGKKIQEIESLLADHSFQPVINDNSNGKISYAAVTAFDLLLRVREREKVALVLSYIYELDVYISVANVAASGKFIFPKALEKGSGALSIEGLYHPELKNPIPNDMAMNNGRAVLFLTGANMAGKSTLLRAVGTAVYIAHMGFPVAATYMEFSVMDGMFTTINLPDNLGIGASHFYAEVLRVKKVAAELKAGKALFVIFDELFRGTNVKDAHEATVAITMAFAGKKNSLFIISSHIVEAGEQLKQGGNIGFTYLPTRMNGQTPEYTYRLETGITDDRHGMIIIRNEGILETLKNGKKN